MLKNIDCVSDIRVQSAPRMSKVSIAVVKGEQHCRNRRPLRRSARAASQRDVLE